MESDVAGFEEEGCFAVVDGAREKVRELLRAAGFAPGATVAFAVEGDVPALGGLLSVLARLLALGRVFARPPGFVIVLLHRLHEFAFVRLYFGSVKLSALVHAEISSGLDAANGDSLGSEDLESDHDGHELQDAVAVVVLASPVDGPVRVDLEVESRPAI